MANVPSDIYKLVKPYVKCPDPIWEVIVQFESGFNSAIVGDGPQVGGYSYGLFQLHVGSGSSSGQGNRALDLISSRTGLQGQSAITYLLQHPDIQAEVGMPPINAAWDALKNSFEPLSTMWWLEFCARSGHPGGSPSDPTTQGYVDRLLNRIIKPNMFSIQQVQAGAGPGQLIKKPNNTWLKQLIDLPPHQPCSVIWRRTCSGAKAAYEGGMDLVSPNGTNVYSLGNGNVIGAGYFWHPNGGAGYGVVTVRTTMPDGSVNDIYYQHIKINPSIILCNQTGGQLYGGVVGPKPTFQPIKTGQLLGTVVVGEVEVGVNADWGGIWGVNHPGPWLDDPEDTVRTLMNNGGGTGIKLPLTTGNSNFDERLQEAFTQTHSSLQTLTQVKGIAGPIQVFHDAQQFKPLVIPDDNSTSANWPVWGGLEQGASYPARMVLGVLNFLVNNTMAFFIRGIFILLALVVILALIINIVSKTTEEEMDTVGKMAPLMEAAI